MGNSYSWETQPNIVEYKRYAKKNSSTTHTPPCENTRISCSYLNEGGTTGIEAPPHQRTSETHCLIRNKHHKPVVFFVYTKESSMLAARYRFHGHGSLRYVYKNGDAFRSRIMTVKAVRNTRRKNPRFAVVVSKKVLKSAVGRNRIRRRVYECMRHEQQYIKKDYDIVVIISSSDVRTMPHDELSDTIRNLLQSADLYL